MREDNIFCKNSAKRSIMSALLKPIVCFLGFFLFFGGGGGGGGWLRGFVKSKYLIRT